MSRWSKSESDVWNLLGVFVGAVIAITGAIMSNEILGAMVGVVGGITALAAGYALLTTRRAYRHGDE